MRFVIILLSSLSATWGQAGAPVRAVTDPGVVTTRQAITPAGVPTVFDGRVYGVAFGRDSSELWVANATRLVRLDWKANRVLDSLALPGLPGLQGIRFDETAARPLIAAARRVAGSNPSVQLFSGDSGKLTALGGDLGTYLAGAIAVAKKPDADGRRLAVIPLTANNELAVVDLTSSSLVGKVPTGIAPFGAAISEDGTIAFVTNWGGRAPRPRDLTATAGQGANADSVVVNPRGVAATGTVSRIDLKNLKVTDTLSVGLHPTAIVWDQSAHRVYIANGNSDTISVIDTETGAHRPRFPLQPFAAKNLYGIAPTALQLSQDGRTLFVACGGINAIMVLDAFTGEIRGTIPTAWYPNGLALSPDGRSLAVSALLGVGPGWREAPSKRYVHADRGAVAVISIPDDAHLASYSTAVAANNRMQLGDAPRAPAAPERTAIEPIPVPARTGDPSPIEHVIFIIKENRTYDQVLGDIAKGNGDPSLVMFGRDVTPNQHKLAEEFVLLDNFYATGGNSADGHQWITQANETDYVMWPGYAGRSYPFDGNDPIAFSREGFIWDLALALGKSVRVYGEFAGHLSIPPALRKQYLERWKNGEDFEREWDNMKAPIASLNNILAKNYPTYSTSIPDVIRARLFLADLHRMEQAGSMPNLILLQLPSNHTSGTTPGASTPKAMVADNDFALGQIVEGLTKSKFWKNTAIFVLEDDAQNGVDHVDGHRTVALAVSPYIRRGHIDSTFYSTQSVLKTIELILGLPTMSLFDLIAEDMRNSFQAQPDFTPFAAVSPTISLFDQNPLSQALRGDSRRAAVASSKMRFDIPDAAPTEKLNRILWHTIRGWGTPYPGARHAVFAPLTISTDDDDRR